MRCDKMQASKGIPMLWAKKNLGPIHIDGFFQFNFVHLDIGSKEVFKGTVLTDKQNDVQGN